LHNLEHLASSQPAPLDVRGGGLHHHQLGGLTVSDGSIYADITMFKTVWIGLCFIKYL
jgi:hypothetical protein